MTKLRGVTSMIYEDHVTDMKVLMPFDLHTTRTKQNRKLFHLKPLAIMHSTFEEVLFLDADNCPVVDVEPLFAHATFRQHGLVIWPDSWRTALDNPAWEIFGVPPKLSECM